MGFFDKLLDILCVMVDLVEFVRLIYFDYKFWVVVEDILRGISGYVEELNINFGLYKVLGDMFFGEGKY